MTNLASHLRNLSSEKLSFKEFKEYITDYLREPEAYCVGTDTDYYKALEEAQEDFIEAYKEYETAFIPRATVIEIEMKRREIERLMNELCKIDAIMPEKVKKLSRSICASLGDANYELGLLICEIS